MRSKFFKLFIISVFAFSSSSGLSFTSAFAKDYIDYISFLQLQKDDQRKIIQTGQMVYSDLEQTQINDINKKIRNLKYTQFESIYNTLIKNAYAADGIREINGNKKNELCIYAGWVTYSKLVEIETTVDGVKKTKKVLRCPHPSNTSISSILSSGFPKGTAEYRYSESTLNKYEDLRKKYCPDNSSNVMVCNPSIFGTQIGSDEPFCSKGNADPYNASWGCINAANKHAKEYAQNNNMTEKEARNKILDKIIMDDIKESKSNPDHQGEITSLASMLQTNYDICMCQGESNFINPRYARVMFKRRTCYAWLTQTKNILDRLKPSGSCTYFSGISYQNKNNSEVANMSNWADEAIININKEMSFSKVDPEKAFEVFKLDNKDDNTWASRKKDSNINCPISFDGKLAANGKNDSEDNVYFIITAEITGNIPRRQKREYGFEPKKDAAKADMVKIPNSPSQMKFKKYPDGPYNVIVSSDGFTSVTVEVPKLLEKDSCTIAQTPIVDDSNNDEKKATVNLKLSSNKIAFDSPDDLKKYEIKWTENVAVSDNISVATYSNHEDKKIIVTILTKSNNELFASCDTTIKARKDDTITDEFFIKIPKNDDKDDHNLLTATVTDKDGNEISEAMLSDKGLTVSWSSSYTKKASGTDLSEAGVDGGSDETVEKDLGNGDKLVDIKVKKNDYNQDVTATLTKDKIEKKATAKVAAIKDEKDEKDVDPFKPKRNTAGGMGRDIPLKQPIRMPGQGQMRFRRNWK